MKIFPSTENRIRCGQCSTEFDFNKNDGCPLCGLGSKNQKPINATIQNNSTNYLAPPGHMKLKDGRIDSDDETEVVGSWGMFNSFFPGKAVSRILGNMQNENKSDSIILKDLIEKSKQVFQVRELTKFRGFPNNIEKENAVGRLVYHFLQTFQYMGLLSVTAKDKSVDDVWGELWTDIEISLTKQGLEFAQIKNKVFDENEPVQVLTVEEKEWLLDYLKAIDKKGYKEFSMLKDVFDFLKQGHNGKDDLWAWFAQNKSFVEYLREGSRKSDDPKAFKKQVENLSTMFAASKIALLRELGMIRNRRNDYTIIGELR